ncbi:MAG: hypothetical protein RI947_1107 [Candidatus Parcubacteria bacterium]|jgi:predicted Zn-dependent peptidase
MKYHSHILKNKLNVLLVDTEAFPSLTTLLLIGAGSRYENKDNNGIAHFFEHMAFKGSRKYTNSFIISSTIEGLGGVFNAFTSKDHTGYWIKATAEHFDTVVDVMSDMILYPKLLQDEIDREKGVIIEEMNMYEDTPSRKVNDVFEEQLYKGNPLGFDIIGTKETVSSFTRDTFVDYMDRLYHPANAVLVVAGGLQNEDTVKKYLGIIEQKFGQWQPQKKVTFEPIVENQSKPHIFVKHKKTEQAHFCLGYRTFSFYDKRKYALSVLSAILGGGMSSRLFIEVRERRGLCYYIGTGREFYHDTGNFVIQAGITNSVDKVQEAAEVTLKELRKMTKGEITADEFIKAKEMIKGRMLLSLEDSQNVASFVGNKKLLENQSITPEEIIKNIENVTKEQLVELATVMFRPEILNFTVLGPFKEKDISIDFSI